MAAPSSKYILTALDIGRFCIIIALGFMATLTFLVSGTILLLMIVETGDCKCFVYMPAGLFVLMIFGISLLVGAIIEGVDAPEVFQNWYSSSKENRELLVLFTISFLAILIVLN
ncbi:MAG: hypothetical protein P8Y67_05915 [Alphaproteobacteria bacterium]